MELVDKNLLDYESNKFLAIKGYSAEEIARQY